MRFLERLLNKNYLMAIRREDMSMYVGGNRWRVHSDEALESMQLISFVALIVRNELFKSLEPLREKRKEKNTLYQLPSENWVG